MIVTVTHSRVIGLLVLVIPMLIGTSRMIIRAILRARERRNQPTHGERGECKQGRLQKVLAHDAILQGRKVKAILEVPRAGGNPVRCRLMSVLAYSGC